MSEAKLRSDVRLTASDVTDVMMFGLRRVMFAPGRVLISKPLTLGEVAALADGEGERSGASQ